MGRSRFSCPLPLAHPLRGGATPARRVPERPSGRRGAQPAAAAVKLPRDARQRRAAHWPGPPADALPLPSAGPRPSCPSPALARGKHAARAWAARARVRRWRAGGRRPRAGGEGPRVTGPVPPPRGARLRGAAMARSPPAPPVGALLPRLRRRWRPRQGAGGRCPPLASRGLPRGGRAAPGAPPSAARCAVRPPCAPAGPPQQPGVSRCSSRCLRGLVFPPFRPAAFANDGERGSSAAGCDVLRVVRATCKCPGCGAVKRGSQTFLCLLVLLA